jgi:hypothetical protein
MEPGGSLPHSKEPAACPCPEPPKSSPCPHPTTLRSILHDPPIYAWVSQVVAFPQVFPPKSCMHLSFPPYVLHAPPSHFSRFDYPNNVWNRHHYAVLFPFPQSVPLKTVQLALRNQERILFRLVFVDLSAHSYRRCWKWDPYESIHFCTRVIKIPSLISPCKRASFKWHILYINVTKIHLF